MQTTPPEAFFLPVDDHRHSQRFCLFHPAQGDLMRGYVLYVHPFAEEMNKSRRMAGLQARALSRIGFAVLQLDLLGCGDSSGDFGDAVWKDWISDVMAGWLWLRTRDNAPANGRTVMPLWLWGLRAGCLLATDVARQLEQPCNFLFWQPPSSGRQLLQQFLRLKVAGDMLSGDAKGIMGKLHQRLSIGSSVEVAGYIVSAGLASGLEHAALVPTTRAGQRCRVEWFELSTRQDANLAPASTEAVALWRQSGFQVGNHVVNGPAFWQTSEIEEAPALIAATTAALSALSA